MLQIINITDARNNLAKLIEKIKATKEPVVIVQDSDPSVVVYPYDEIVKREEEKNQLFQLKFQQIFREGEKKFRQYLRKKSIRTSRSEKDAYSIIKNA
ncbi:MAG: type II toxin-antitoxin system Phd/YefM family antitoxin [Candidatus Levybacteria bacterium]|nr:type II toxin-antitoxin system Phd/YefM family antitoxin [Candidatus Levybacteria bacterium]MBI2622563.1 type II toxin-antitoxin system Phd/YefM family antitoxin [Candidatus Levybacteria bacterium]